MSGANPITPAGLPGIGSPSTAVVKAPSSWFSAISGFLKNTLKGGTEASRFAMGAAFTGLMEGKFKFAAKAAGKAWSLLPTSLKVIGGAVAGLAGLKALRGLAKEKAPDISQLAMQYPPYPGPRA